MLPLTQSKDKLQFPQTFKDFQSKKDVDEATRAIFALFPSFKKDLKKYVGTDNRERIQGS